MEPNPLLKSWAWLLWHISQVPVDVFVVENDSLWSAVEGSVFGQNAAVNVEEFRAIFEIKCQTFRPEPQQNYGLVIWILAIIGLKIHKEYKNTALQENCTYCCNEQCSHGNWWSHLWRQNKKLMSDQLNCILPYVSSLKQTIDHLWLNWSYVTEQSHYFNENMASLWFLQGRKCLSTESCVLISVSAWQRWSFSYKSEVSVLVCVFSLKTCFTVVTVFEKY